MKIGDGINPRRPALRMAGRHLKKPPKGVTRFEKPELYFFEVEDHASTSNTTFEDAIARAHIRAVGWLIAEDDTRYFLMMSSNFYEGEDPFASVQMDCFTFLKSDVRGKKKLRVAR